MANTNRDAMQAILRMRLRFTVPYMPNVEADSPAEKP